MFSNVPSLATDQQEAAGNGLDQAKLLKQIMSCKVTHCEVTLPCAEGQSVHQGAVVGHVAAEAAHAVIAGLGAVRLKVKV